MIKPKKEEFNKLWCAIFHVISDLKYYEIWFFREKELSGVIIPQCPSNGKVVKTLPMHQVPFGNTAQWIIDVRSFAQKIKTSEPRPFSPKCIITTMINVGHNYIHQNNNKNNIEQKNKVT